jgi:hypothetical protein
MIPTEKISKAMFADRAFIIAVVSCNSIIIVRDKYQKFLDSEGYAPFYEMVLEIVDELMFTKGSEYLKYARAKNKEDWFSNHHDTFMDWYFIQESEKLLHRELKGWGK